MRYREHRRQCAFVPDAYYEGSRRWSFCLFRAMEEIDKIMSSDWRAPQQAETAIWRILRKARNARLLSVETTTSLIAACKSSQGSGSSSSFVTAISDAWDASDGDGLIVLGFLQTLAKSAWPEGPQQQGCVVRLWMSFVFLPREAHRAICLPNRGTSLHFAPESSHPHGSGRVSVITRDNETYRNALHHQDRQSGWVIFDLLREPMTSVHLRLCGCRGC